MATSRRLKRITQTPKEIWGRQRKIAQGIAVMGVVPKDALVVRQTPKATAITPQTKQKMERDFFSKFIQNKMAFA